MRIATNPRVFEHETRIVIDRPEDMTSPFLREVTTYPGHRRTGRPSIFDGTGKRLVAYAEVCAEAATPERRVWYLGSDDPYAPPHEDNCPTEGVWPESLKAGHESYPALPFLLKRGQERRPLGPRELQQLASSRVELEELQKERAAWKPRAVAVLRPLVIRETGRLGNWLVVAHCPWCHEEHQHGAGPDLEVASGYRVPDCASLRLQQLGIEKSSTSDYEILISATSLELARRRNKEKHWKGWPGGVVYR